MSAAAQEDRLRSWEAAAELNVEVADVIHAVFDGSLRWEKNEKGLIVIPRSALEDYRHRSA